MRFYKNSLSRALAYPKITGIVAILILASAAIPLQFITSDSHDSEERTRIYMQYHLKGQFPLEQVEAMVNRMEAYLFEHQDEFYIDSVYSYYASGRASTSLFLRSLLSRIVSTSRPRLVGVTSSL